MSALYRFAIRRPLTVLALAAVAVMAVAPGTLWLRVRTDGHALVQPDAPAVLADKAVREEFHILDPVVLLVRTDDPKGLFNTHTLQLVADLTDRVLALDGVKREHVFSLATEHMDKVIPGTLRPRTFLHTIPTTPEDLATLRSDFKAMELYDGTLISRDEQATAVMVGAPYGVDRTVFYADVCKVVESLGDVPERIDVIGAPVAESLLGTHILEDLGVPPALLGHRAPPWEVDDVVGEGHTLFRWQRWVARHIGLVPVALALMSLVFLIAFRSVWGMLLPLMEVGACLVFVFGLMGFSDVPIYLTIAVLPVILTAIGVADEVHIFSHYREVRRERPDGDIGDVVLATMTDMASPVIKTSVTTTVGFLSFTLSPLKPVQAFGVFTSVGILFCMLWSLTVIPAMLCLLKPRGMGRPAEGGTATPRATFFERFGTAIIRWRVAVIVLIGLAVLLAPLGVRRVKVQDSWIDGFAPESAFHQAITWFNDQFLGTHILLIEVDGGGGDPASGSVTAEALDHHEIRLPGDLVDDPAVLVGMAISLIRKDRTLAAPDAFGQRRAILPWESWIEAAARRDGAIVVTTKRADGSAAWAMKLEGRQEARFEINPRPLLQPEVVRRVKALEMFVAKHEAEAVGGVIGTGAYIETTNFMAKARKPGSRSIPDDPRSLHLTWKHYHRVLGEERTRQVVSEDYGRSVISVYMRNANFVDTARLLDEIRAYEREHLAPSGMHLTFAGDVAVSQSLIGAIVSTQVRSLALSLVGVVLVAALMGRSLRWGVLCVLPCAVAVLVNFAIMGWVSMPLGVATSMFSGMTLGIGVDYAIHLLDRYRRTRARGVERDAAIREAVGATGPAIMTDALAVALGFGSLVLSQVPANARLGLLVVVSIAGCFITTMLLLPALLALGRRSDGTLGPEEVDGGLS